MFCSFKKNHKFKFKKQGNEEEKQQQQHFIFRFKGFTVLITLWFHWLSWL